jgi:hypothetical protein
MMRYEREYMDFLVSESIFNKKIPPILDKYFLDEWDFRKVIDSVGPAGVTTYEEFLYIKLFRNGG